MNDNDQRHLVLQDTVSCSVKMGSRPTNVPASGISYLPTINNQNVQELCPLQHVLQQLVPPSTNHSCLSPPTGDLTAMDTVAPTHVLFPLPTAPPSSSPVVPYVAPTVRALHPATMPLRELIPSQRPTLDECESLTREEEMLNALSNVTKRKILEDDSIPKGKIPQGQLVRFRRSIKCCVIFK
jgi:hypothetical protein